MKNLLINTKFIIAASFLISLFSLFFDIVQLNSEWFSASGGILTIGGVLLAARKIFRLGIKEFISDMQIIDGNPLSKELQTQFEKDIQSYRWSIWLFIIGTLIWAYGGIVLRLCIPKQ